MSDTVRLGVLKQLSDYLATEVTVANGYNNTLTASVFRGRFWFSSDDPLPMVSILEGITPDRNPVTAGYGQDLQSDKWVLLIQGWVQDDHDNPTDPAHILMGDVKKALGKVRKRLANMEFAGSNTAFENVAEIGIEPGVVRPPDQLSERAYFWLRAVVQIVEEVDSPFLSP
jgi:hypothetical protein